MDTVALESLSIDVCTFAAAAPPKTKTGDRQRKLTDPAHGPHSPRILPLGPLPNLQRQHSLDTRPRFTRTHSVPAIRAAQASPDLNNTGDELRDRATRGIPVCDGARHRGG